MSTHKYFYVKLSSPCSNVETDEKDIMEVNIQFYNEHVYDQQESMSFDNTIQVFNRGLPDEWFCDDIIEPVRTLTELQAEIEGYEVYDGDNEWAHLGPNRGECTGENGKHTCNMFVT